MRSLVFRTPKEKLSNTLATAKQEKICVLLFRIIMKK